jgi:hypothetical protein
MKFSKIVGYIFGTVVAILIVAYWVHDCTTCTPDPVAGVAPMAPT